MNKIAKILLTLFIALCLPICLITPVCAYAEDVEPEEQVLTGTVVVNKFEHGEYELSAESGNVGDVIEIKVSPKVFYIVGSVSVNGSVLIESEETSGLYSFVLVEGENIVVIEIVLDQETLGAAATIINEVKEQDWESLFSVETIMTIVAWLLDGGILIAIVRYFIKDKKLEAKVEEAIKNNINEVIPQSTKDTVVASIQTNMVPLFEKYEQYIVNMQQAMSTFSKCMALSTEGTPESKLAILEALGNLEIGDKTATEHSKEYIKEMVEKAEIKFQETMEALNKIETTNKEIIEKTEVVSAEPVENNGTMI